MTMRERIARRIAAAELTSYLDLADAILDELREPTEAMRLAGLEHSAEEVIIDGKRHVVSWSAMLNAAKQERG